MSHAWLFTGPPGSGRSNAAVAFAAALQCEHAGLGPECPKGCHDCRTVLAGSHADVAVIRTEKLTIGVKEVRDLVRRAALTPMGRRWQILIVEDADRLTEQACNALLKAIEEPNARTVWMLCAPTVEDVLPTIRSRCRLVALSTPTAAEVAGFLEALGCEAGRASYAARASQGHIGRARALAFDDAVRDRRQDVVGMPARLTSLGPLPGGGGPARRGRQGGGRRDHRRARRAGEGRPRHGVRRGRARPPAAGVRPGPA